MPVIPDTQETEAGELLEPEMWRLQWAEIMPPLHSSLGNRVRLCLKNNNKNKNKPSAMENEFAFSIYESINIMQKA